MLIKNGLIHDAVNEAAYIADIYIEDGKIEKIGTNLDAEDSEVIEASGKYIYPGLVECHCHLGIRTYGSDNSDTNERNDIISPQLRGIDGFDPLDKYVKKARENGVTTIAAGPGSLNIVGGTFFAAKTSGSCVDDMLIKNDVAMKCAFGENPKKGYSSKCDSSRFTTAAKMRELLFMTEDYLKRKELAADDYSKMPKFDMKLEAMIPVIKGEMPLKAHAHRTDDICTAIRIAKEFNLKMTLEHCTEGHLIADEIARAGYPVAVGPSMSGAGKAELANKSFTTPGVLAKAGVNVSITTDAPITQIEFLTIAAALAVKNGMGAFDALRAITINPAMHLGIADKVGSIEVGKDADIIIADGDILEVKTIISDVLIEGTKVN